MKFMSSMAFSSITCSFFAIRMGKENIYNIYVYKYCWQKYLKFTMENSHTFTLQFKFQQNIQPYPKQWVI